MNMYTKWTAEFTSLTLMAFLLILPVGIICAVRDNEWTLIALFVAAIGMDLRIATSTSKAGSGN